MSDSTNSTNFYLAAEADENREKFDSLRKHNSKEWRNKSMRDKNVVREKDNHHLFDAISSQLELSDYQQERGLLFVENVNFSDVGYCIEASMFAVCVIAAHTTIDYERIPEKERYWMSCSDTKNRFSEFADELDLSDQAIDGAINDIVGQIGGMLDD